MTIDAKIDLDARDVDGGAAFGDKDVPRFTTHVVGTVGILPDEGGGTFVEHDDSAIDELDPRAIDGRVQTDRAIGHLGESRGGRDDIEKLDVAKVGAMDHSGTRCRHVGAVLQLAVYEIEGVRREQ